MTTGDFLQLKIQLFYFGTYLPHRASLIPFADQRRAHNSRFGYWPSLLTCFHFGHHRTHHQPPYVPWWGLPAVNRAVDQAAR